MTEERRRTLSFLKKKQRSDENLLIYEEDNWKFEDEEEEQPIPNSASFSASTGQVKVSIEEEEEGEPELFVDPTLSTSKQKAHVWDLDTKTGRIKFKIHLVVDHLAARLFSVLLVCIDIVLVIIALGTEDDSEGYSYATLAIVSYFMLELMLRIFAWGEEFFHHRLEVIDMIIVVLSFITTIVFEVITIDQHLKFGKLIIVFRLLRILMLSRICVGRKHLERSTRNLISQNKRRYVKDGFDLDLTYITDRMIAMSFPSSGKTSMYRNPISEVARFFNTKYPGHYKIYNLCSERHYETHWFNDSVERVLIDDHNVPRLSQLVQFVHSADEWMKKDEQNMLVLHCKGGKGRTGTAVAAWLLFSGQFKSADKALNYFGIRRTDEAKGNKYQGVETPSQSRYVRYLEKVIYSMNGRLPQPKQLRIKSVKITGLKTVGNGDGSDLSVEIVQNGQIIHKVVFNEPGTNFLKTKGDSLKVIFNEKDNLMVVGDTKVRFHSSNTSVPKDYDFCAFFFWFHTSFIENKRFYVERNDIGNCHKRKYWKTYTEKFSVTVKFVDPDESK
ncbi:phosphatidylinositol 3,4,5-trisphosphate 3-phosphatase TPTE2-like isoform X2 [Clytia hemisphaerica]|uniref:Phosphatidylinositol-3,4,5-trisphosphate 3-phosphatase n=1 Tax=Clytia hemisphaerica TaxID=252671 RepID=A0A7M5VFF4_9CNID